MSICLDLCLVLTVYENHLALGRNKQLYYFRMMRSLLMMILWYISSYTHTVLHGCLSCCCCCAARVYVIMLFDSVLMMRTRKSILWVSLKFYCLSRLTQTPIYSSQNGQLLPFYWINVRMRWMVELPKIPKFNWTLCENFAGTDEHLKRQHADWNKKK